MLEFIDKKIEKLMIRGLHKKRDKIVAKTMKNYLASNHLSDDEASELNKKLLEDSDRFLKIIDKSVIRATLIRARYTFWITAIIATAIVIGLAAYPVTTSIVPFFVPLMAAFVGWAVTVATIPVSYIQSLEGIMDATIAAFEKEQQDKQEKVQVKTLSPNVDELKNMLLELQRQIEKLSQPANDNTPIVNAAEKFNDYAAPSITTSGTGLWLSRRRTQGKESLINEAQESSPHP